ncbi:MAG: SDR family NAD(P)-dependent oxidoreductase, partial [Chloroflexota bacterium]|nr:SDR family NAD(P)-dependent oxidoreductase [Chloroflexota bacterium]
MRELAGKVAVVTGAASGMGNAFAERLARAGMKVVLADVEAPALERAADALRDAGHDVRAAACDVSQGEAVERLAAE